MSRPIRFTVRFLVLVAVIAAIPMFVTQQPSQSPYLSALSNLAATSASAAPTCNNKICNAGPRISFKCISNTGTNCTSNHFDCSNSTC